jgi:hypothetical protein
VSSCRFFNGFDSLILQGDDVDYLSQYTSESKNVSHFSNYQQTRWPASGDTWRYEAASESWNDDVAAIPAKVTELPSSRQACHAVKALPSSVVVGFTAPSASRVSAVSASKPTAQVSVDARKNAETGSPYRRHTADLIRRIDVLLSHRSAQPTTSTGTRSRKPRSLSGGGQRPRARNVVLRELVELLRKALLDDEVCSFLLISRLGFFRTEYDTIPGDVITGHKRSFRKT